MPSDNPSISVIIPVHNGANFLSEAIGSVLDQTLPATEIIVVDDGSTDNSYDVAQSLLPEGKVIRQDNAGAGEARNNGIQHSTGEYVAFLDHDDLMVPNRLEVQVRPMLESDQLEGTFGKQYFFEGEDDPRPKVAKGDLDPSSVFPAILAGGMVCRRGVFDRSGGFEPGLQQAEFINWFAKAKDSGFTYLTLTDIVCCRRVHKHNMTRNLNSVEYTRAIKAILDRRRQEQKSREQ